MRTCVSAILGGVRSGRKEIGGAAELYKELNMI